MSNIEFMYKCTMYVYDKFSYASDEETQKLVEYFNMKEIDLAEMLINICDDDIEDGRFVNEDAMKLIRACKALEKLMNV